MISILFLQMHTLKIEWQKVTTDFNKFGLYYRDTEMEQLVSLKNEPIYFLKNYFGVYKGVIFKIAIINVVQPYEFLNSDQLFINLESSINFVNFLKYKSQGDFQKYYGSYNDYLLMFFLVLRVYFMVKYMVSFFYMN